MESQTISPNASVVEAVRKRKLNAKASAQRPNAILHVWRSLALAAIAFVWRIAMTLVRRRAVPTESPLPDEWWLVTPPTRVQTRSKRSQPPDSQAISTCGQSIAKSCTAGRPEPAEGGNEEARLPESSDDDIEYEADVLRRAVASSTHQRAFERPRSKPYTKSTATCIRRPADEIERDGTEKEHAAARAAASWMADADDTFDEYYHAKDGLHRERGKHSRGARQTMQRAYAVDARMRQREAAGVARSG